MHDRAYDNRSAATSTRAAARGPGSPDLGEPIAHGASGVARRLAAFDAILPLRGGAILDVGCGNGAYTLLLLDRFASVDAVDVEPDRMADLRQRAEGSAASRLRVSAMSVEQLDFADSSFDSVTAIEVLEHVVDLKRSIAEIRRVLRPGGALYVSVPNRLFPFETHMIRLPGGRQVPGRRVPFLPYLRRLHSQLATARNFSADELRALLTAGGFEEIGTGYVMPPFDRWSLGRWLIRPITDRLERSPLRVLGVSIVAVYRAT